MKRKFLILVVMITAIISIFAITAGAKEAYLEQIPSELLFSNDTVTHFIVFDGEEYFNDNGSTISAFNTTNMDAELVRLGISASDIGTKYLTKFVFPSHMNGTLVTYVNLNSLKGNSTYFWGKVGYVEIPGTVTQLHDMNQAVNQLRGIDFGENSQLKAMPGYICNAATKLKTVKNFPRNLTGGIGTNAFNGCTYAFSGELYINATTIGDGAFNNAYTRVTGMVFGELVKTIGGQSFSIRAPETALGTPLLEYIEFKGDVTKITLTTVGNDKGSFVFAKGSGNQRSSFTNLKCVILSNEANKSAIVEGETLLTELNSNILLNEDSTKVVVYTSHGADVENTTITYEALSQAGVKTTPCTRCYYIDKSETAPIYTAKGYSVSDNGAGLAGGYNINKDALEQWQKYGGSESVKFGIMLVNPKYLVEDSFFSAYGALNATAGAIQVETISTAYSSFDYMINGFTSAHANMELVIAGYVIVDGEYQLVQMEYDMTNTPALSKVTKSEGSLYTVTISTVANKQSIVELPEYVAPTKED